MDAALRLQRFSRLALPLLGLWLATLAFYWRLITPDPAQRRYFGFGDFTLQFFPFHRFASDELAAGRLAMWDPYMYSGHPFQADIQAAVLYPIALLNEWFSRGTFGFLNLEWEVVLHVGLAATFTFLFARLVFGSSWAALLAAVTFAFSGFLTSYPTQQLPVLESTVWLPAELYCIERAAISLRARSSMAGSLWLAAAGGAIGVAVLAGHPQSVLYLVYCGGAYFLLRIPWRSWWRAVWLALVAGGLAAAQLLPTLQLFAVNAKGPLDYDFAAGGLVPGDLLGLVLDRPAGGRLVYLGLVPLALAILALTRLNPLGRRATGAVTNDEASPITLSVERRVSYPAQPGDASLDAQHDSTTQSPTPDSRLPTPGQAPDSRLPTPGRVSPTQPLFWTITAILALLLSLGSHGPLYRLFFDYVPGWNLFRDQERAVMLFALAVSMLAGYGLLAFTSGLDKRRTIAVAGVTVLAAFANLFWANSGNNQVATSPETVQPPTLLAPVKADPDIFRVRISEDSLGHDTGNLFRLQYVSGESPFELQSFKNWSEDQTAGPRVTEWQLMRLTNSHYVVSDRALCTAACTDSDGLTELATEGPLRLYGVRFPLPRAYFVAAAQPVASQRQAIDAINQPGFDAQQTILLQGSPPAHSTPFDANARLRADVVGYAPGFVDIRANSDRPAYLQISEVAYPDWQATVDGSGASIITADGLFMAVDVPAGDHHVVLRYVPRPFQIGAAISLLSIAAVAFLSIRALIPSPSGRGPG